MQQFRTYWCITKVIRHLLRRAFIWEPQVHGYLRERWWQAGGDQNDAGLTEIVKVLDSG